MFFQKLLFQIRCANNFEIIFCSNSKLIRSIVTRELLPLRGCTGTFSQVTEVTPAIQYWASN